MSRLQGRALSWAITATAGSGFLLFGYDQGVMSGLLTGQYFVETFPEIDTTGFGSASLQGTVVAIYEIGCFFGAILCFLVGEKIGRRRCIMIGCVTLSIGALLQATSYGIPQLIVGRIVAGLGNGMNTSAIPVWHSELMKAESRGQGLAIELAINIFGVMLSYWVDYGMSFVRSQSQFRFPLGLQILFAIATFIGIVFLPESPRWLIAHDRHDEARNILSSLERGHKDTEAYEETLNQTMTEIQLAIKEEREAANQGSFKTLLKNGEQKFLYRTLLGIGGQFMQQISGVNLITYYAPVIFQQSVGIPHDTSLLLAGFIGVCFFLSSLIPIWLIERLGRRKLMLFAAAGQGVAMAVLAVTVHDGGKKAGLAATVMLFFFIFCFAIGLLAIPWLLPPEYSPLAVRAKSSALATASNWIFTFLVVEITPVSIKNIGWGTYAYFCVFNFLFIPLIYFYYPETKGLSLEQINDLFTGPKTKLHWTEDLDIKRRAQEVNKLEAIAKTEHIDWELGRYSCPR